jgi:hypothetical protein
MVSRAAASGPSSAVIRRRWPRAGRGQRPLLGAAAMACLGAFLPWIYTGVGTVSGARGAGLWVFYAATLGLAGALVPFRRVAALQAAVLAVVAVGLAVWQVVHLVSLVGLQGWLPGPGLVLTLGAGVLAATAARSLFSERP